MNIKKLVAEALIGFLLWTTFLTPYMVFVVRVDLYQFLSWLGMQAILVPIISPIVFRTTQKIMNSTIGVKGFGL